MVIGKTKYLKTHNKEDRTYEELSIGGRFAPYIVQVKDNEGDVICVTKGLKLSRLRSIRTQLKEKLRKSGFTHLIIKQQEGALYLIHPIKTEVSDE